MLSHSRTRRKLYRRTPMRKLALIVLMAGAILMGMACGDSDDGEVEDVIKVAGWRSSTRTMSPGRYYTSGMAACRAWH